MKKFLMAAVSTVALAGISNTASAVAIQVGFNFNGSGTWVANNSPASAAPGDVTTAISISGGGPYTVAAIILNNINLVTGQGLTLTDPVPTVLGQSFTKVFTTSSGTFTELLTVIQVTPGPTAMSISATGTIDDGPGGFDPTPVFFSASWTQNSGPGTQINGSFNNSTIPVTTPEPASLAVLGAGLLGLGMVRRRRA